MKNKEDIQDDVLYYVVCNEEEQYSVWLSDKPVPCGWVKVTGTLCRDDCLDYIKQHWLDMRPKSIRTSTTS